MMIHNEAEYISEEIKMAARLFVFLAEGTVTDSADFRLGSRHHLMIFVTALSLKHAKTQALSAAFEDGWSHTEIKKGFEIEAGLHSIVHETPRDAAREALREGSGIVAYEDEIAPNG